MSLCERCDHSELFHRCSWTEGAYYICKARRDIVVRDRTVCYDYRRKEEGKK